MDLGEPAKTRLMAHMRHHRSTTKLPLFSTDISRPMIQGQPWQLLTTRMVTIRFCEPLAAVDLSRSATGDGRKIAFDEVPERPTPSGSRQYGPRSAP